MNLKISWIEIQQDILPHTDTDSEKDLEFLANEILEAYEIGGISEEIELDDKLFTITTALTSKLTSSADIPKIIELYRLGKWGKLLSGDISSVIGESVAYTLLIQKFNVSIKDILPFRNVKYTKTITDLVINIEKYPKLREFLKADRGLLFVNARATMSYKRSYILKRLIESISIIENVRYPDHFGLVSYIVKLNDEYHNICVIIRPR